VDVVVTKPIFCDSTTVSAPVVPSTAPEKSWKHARVCGRLSFRHRHNGGYRPATSGVTSVTSSWNVAVLVMLPSNAVTVTILPLSMASSPAVYVQVHEPVAVPLVKMLPKLADSVGPSAV